MGFIDRTRAAYRAFRASAGYDVRGGYPGPWIPAYDSDFLPEDPRTRYKLLDLYYEGTAYRAVNQVLERLQRNTFGIRELENPTEQAVEFHAAHLFPGTLPDALPIESENERLAEAIEKIWVWSNWGQKKQVYARWIPHYADAFIKATQTEDKKNPYMQLIHPSVVSKFDKDSRGNLTHALLEKEVKGNDAKKTVIRAEEWSKEEDRLRIWFADTYGTEWEKRLSGYDETQEKRISDFGMDFVPLVHAVFAPDLSEPDGRGVCAIAPKVAQIDEINKAVTALHDRFFRHGKPDKAFMAGESGVGAPVGRRRNDDTPDPSHGTIPDAREAQLDGEKTYYLPGLARMEYLIPNIPYADGLAMIKARQDKLAENLPELRFYSEVDVADSSGVARRIRLAPAVSRAREARGNAEDAMIRVQKMCLTLGVKSGAIEDIGSFESGDFDHSFEEREILPVSDEERFASEKVEADALAAEIQLFQQLGIDTEPLKKRAAQLAGIDEKDLVDTVPLDVEQARTASFQRSRTLLGVPNGQGGTRA